MNIRTPGMHRDLPTTPADMDAIGWTDVDKEKWEVEHESIKGEHAITLTFTQWAQVLATLRVAAAFSPHPGPIVIAHHELKRQVTIGLDASVHTRHDQPKETP